MMGAQLTDEDIRLLVHYLTQEDPGQVSFKKLYLAFAQIEGKDEPLSQEGSQEIAEYDKKIKE